MKLFYRKDYKRVSGDLEIAKIELNKAHFKLERYREGINRLEEENKSINASKGGFTKEINKLKCELIEKDNLIDEKQKMIDELNDKIKILNDKLEESMTDKYIVKKLKPGRTPNLNKTKISAPMSSNVRKFMKENFD